MKFWAVLGSQGCREKRLPAAIGMQLFGVVFSTFCDQEKKNSIHTEKLKSLKTKILSKKYAYFETASFNHLWQDLWLLSASAYNRFNLVNNNLQKSATTSCSFHVVLFFSMDQLVTTNQIQKKRDSLASCAYDCNSCNKANT